MRGGIVVIVPTEREAAGLVAAGVEVEVCGVGMAECGAVTASVIVERRPKLVVLAGVAGSYCDELGLGEVVAVKEEVVADLGRLAEEESGDGVRKFTPLYQKTYLAPVWKVEGLKSVNSRTVNMAGGMERGVAGVWASGRTLDEPEVENMEGAAFFAVCRKLGVEGMQLRAISNRVGEPVEAQGLGMAVERLTEEVVRVIEGFEGSEEGRRR